MRDLRIGSLFSGIGGLELGLERAGFGPVAWQVEIDPFPRAVLEKHWPNAVRHEDVKAVGAHNLSPVDVICGGFPCQDISLAGRGAGLSGERSGLWFEYLRIVRELQPALVIIENVAALRKRGLPTVLAGLEDAGYRSTVLDIAASDVGAPHRRKRIFIVAERVADAASGARFGRASGHEGHAAFGGEGVADADSGRRVSRVADDDAREPDAQGGGELADACGRRLEGRGERDGDPVGPEQQAPLRHDAHGRDSDLGDADGEGSQGHGRPVPHQRAAGAPSRSGPAHGSGARPEEHRPAEPGMGRAVDGLSQWLDRVAARSAWPSRPGEAQAPWEAPRTAANVAARGARLKGIGNAVVPQCAEAVGLWVAANLAPARARTHTTRAA